MDKIRAKEILTGSEYYSIDDLRYNKQAGFFMSKAELNDFFNIKNQLLTEDKNFVILPLQSFNSKNIYYSNGSYISNNLNSYYATLFDDFQLNNKLLFKRNFQSIMDSRIFSEIEGTLNIENVPTTRTRIQKICNSDKLLDKNDIIIKNMATAIDFIKNDKPEFNKENLLKLYKILSDNCLAETDKLTNGYYYRHDSVYVGDFAGAPVEQIESLMDSLFTFANDNDNLKKYGVLLPHICHYYLLYVHPYFDYNGRTARMISFWISYINDINDAPIFISEAINEYKSEYYRALKNSRITGNDLTYFLGFLLETSIQFSLIYKNIEDIQDKLSKNGDFLTNTELQYIKKILAHNPRNYFNYQLFCKYINNNISKQGALKMLNVLAEYKVLIKTSNKKGDAIFKVNPDFITYEIK